MSLFELQAELTPFLLERMSGRQTVTIHTWVFVGQFLEKEQSQAVTSRETTVSICCP